LSRLRSILNILVVAAAIFGLDQANAFRWADNIVTEGRMAAAPREASGQVVFIGIDRRSLEQIATWPWPREIYADIIGRLLSLGATEVFFDIDFSSSSTPQSDTILAAALQEAGGAIILPAFRQSAGIAAPTSETRDNLPLPLFRTHAWLASVNFQADLDGITRRLPWGLHIAGSDIPSAASTISGVFGPAGEYFPINFAILPDTVPTYSVADLLKGRLEVHHVEGRSIIVGGHAAELGDTLSVPVHGVVNGVILQVLGAETLLQGIVPRPLRTLPILTLITILGATIAISPLSQNLSQLTATYCVVALLIEAGAFVLQAQSPSCPHWPYTPFSVRQH
jgi:CHASE2 domain-containing sensor protein